MLVRILIERHFKKEREAEGIDKILEMRGLATKQSGYVSGETLTDTRDTCTIIIVSTWRSLDEWKRWEASADHRRLVSAIDPLLDQPATVRAFVNPWDALMD